MTQDTVIGLDLAKHIFHLVTLNGDGKLQHKKKLRRTQLKRYMSNLPASKIAMEACSGSHYFAREFIAMGHRVELLPAQHVKAYQRGQKNDYNDAQAIAEASLHGQLRSVPIKTPVQQSQQAFHRVRNQVNQNRTQLILQIRGLLSEFGVLVAQGSSKVRSSLPSILEDAENELPDEFRILLSRQYQRLVQLDEELKWCDAQLTQQMHQDPVCQRLIEVPGIGPVVSSALLSWMGDARQFARGREASAALGIVPRQHSTGGKPRLGGITKRGDSYVRKVLIHGARSVVRLAGSKTDVLSMWINRLVQRRGFNKAVVALANKLVRIAWVIIAKGERYQPRVTHHGRV